MIVHFLQSTQELKDKDPWACTDIRSVSKNRKDERGYPIPECLRKFLEEDFRKWKWTIDRIDHINLFRLDEIVP